MTQHNFLTETDARHYAAEQILAAKQHRSHQQPPLRPLDQGQPAAHSLRAVEAKIDAILSGMNDLNRRLDVLESKLPPNGRFEL